MMQPQATPTVSPVLDILDRLESLSVNVLEGGRVIEVFTCAGTRQADWRVLCGQMALSGYRLDDCPESDRDAEIWIWRT